MSHIREFVESGILELYVMGMANAAETAEVEALATAHPEIKLELEAISVAMENYAIAHAVQPRATVKPLLMATIDYLQRIQTGELPEQPPILNPESGITDFSPWLNRKDMNAPAAFEGIYAKLIGATGKTTTAIVWIKGMTDYEIHHDEHESFLIVEGSCEFHIGDTVHTLLPGDFLSVPLHKPHWAKITSDIPCKAILQRRAA